MRIVTNYRACGVLYNFLLSNNVRGTALMPANICETVPATYMKAGLNIEFVDIGTDNFQPSQNEIMLTLVKDKEISILHYNHTYGYLDESEDNRFFKTVKDKYPNIVIVDDRCLCAPILPSDNQSNTADVYLYSTGKVKYVDLGYGGFAYINDKYFYDEFLLPFNSRAEDDFDKHIKYCHSKHCAVDTDIMLGDWLNNSKVNNYGFDRIADCLKKVATHKKRLNTIYDTIKVGSIEGSAKYNAWRYQVLVENQKECLKAIFDDGLFASSHYMSLCNGYFSNAKTPNVDRLESHVINLFNDFRFNEKQAQKVVDILNDVAVPVEK